LAKIGEIKALAKAPQACSRPIETKPEAKRKGFAKEASRL